MLCLTVPSPLGDLLICEEEGKLTHLLFSSSRIGTDSSVLLLRAKEELEEYFRGERTEFDLPLAFHGTAFETAVFSALLGEVEYGKTVTYSALAALCGHPRACRVVGNCLHKNPLPIFIPCHRVVAKAGIGNYFAGLEKKEFLMRLEGITL